MLKDAKKILVAFVMGAGIALCAMGRTVTVSGWLTAFS